MRISHSYQEKISRLFVNLVGVDLNRFAYENHRDLNKKGWTRVNTSRPNHILLGRGLTGELNGNQAIAFLLNRYQTPTLILDVDRKNGKPMEDVRCDYLKAVEVMGVFPSVVFRSRRTGFHAYWFLDRRVPTAYATDVLKLELQKKGVRDIEVKPTHDDNLTIPNLNRRADVETLGPFRTKYREAWRDLRQFTGWKNRIPVEDVLGGVLTRESVYETESSAGVRKFEERRARIQLLRSSSNSDPTGSFPYFSPGHTQRVVLGMIASLRVRGYDPEEAIDAILEHAKASPGYNGDLTQRATVAAMVRWDRKRNEDDVLQETDAREELNDSESDHSYDPTYYLRNADFSKRVSGYVVRAAEIFVKRWGMRNPKQKRSVINFICYLFFMKEYRRNEFRNPEKAGQRQYANRYYVENMSKGYFELPSQSMKTVYASYKRVLRLLKKEQVLSERPYNSYSNHFHYSKVYKINHDHKTLLWAFRRALNEDVQYDEGIALNHWERVLYESLVQKIGLRPEGKWITNAEIMEDRNLTDAGFKPHRLSKTITALEDKGLVEKTLRHVTADWGGTITKRRLRIYSTDSPRKRPKPMNGWNKESRTELLKFGSLRAIYEYKGVHQRFSVWAQRLLTRVNGRTAQEIMHAPKGGRPKKDILVSEETYQKAAEDCSVVIGHDIPEAREMSRYKIA